LSWHKNHLTISGPEVPGGKVVVWYLEAYCRSGSTDRDWRETVIPHRTEVIEADAGGKLLLLRCRLPAKADGERDGEGVVVDHEIRAGRDEVSFRVLARNQGREYVDAVWVQPCIRVGDFTGRGQKGYIQRSFIFTEKGLMALDQLPRAEAALYRGGQVYVPAGVDRRDVNPRPISPAVPAKGLIGCFSRDGRKLLATAWEPYQELFQGVIVCLHSDFRLGGLKPGEVKEARGKIYLLENDVEGLVERYDRDFEGR
jgi:hypothetical protein